MRRAFTMIELIFVVVIIGIIAVYVAPSFKRDELYEATHQVLEHIRYTQHLAMSETKFDPMDKTYHKVSGSTTYDGLFHRSWWQIRFLASSSNVYYRVYSDRDREGNVDTATHVEPAVDPLTKEFLLYDTAVNANATRKNTKMLLSEKYHISSVSASGGCMPESGSPTTVEIFFDDFGRPYSGASAASTARLYRYRIATDCYVTIAHRDTRQSVITIKPETGYAFISNFQQ